MTNVILPMRIISQQTELPNNLAELPTERQQPRPPVTMLMDKAHWETNTHKSSRARRKINKVRRLRGKCCSCTVVAPSAIRSILLSRLASQLESGKDTQAEVTIWWLVLVAASFLWWVTTNTVSFVNFCCCCSVSVGAIVKCQVLFLIWLWSC